MRAAKPTYTAWRARVGATSHRAAQATDIVRLVHLRAGRCADIGTFGNDRNVGQLEGVERVDDLARARMIVVVMGMSAAAARSIERQASGMQ